MGYGIAKDSFFVSLKNYALILKELTDRVIERNNKEVLEILRDVANDSVQITDIFTRKTGPFYTLELTLLVDPSMVFFSNKFTRRQFTIAKK